ncbi:hypothetical protein GCM10010215_68520 [Streptomyces virginiae]|uniref:Uncharacterized protein n=1 Tax=Streptomyces virginiae TaxID=1961 RepID=A0ABQ3NKQ4_STRVG|nr:hypothetical protein [Streptomyces virginiae]MBP2342763.1 hypothetical protein [Streptomyces virginiae]GGQ34772.1 hypothetical protein GCM10010215_68520 [Streptomyces virginiae]GHI13349.1 hypothetical protein Scinn_28120 [Streptomyces virginiae]
MSDPRGDAPVVDLYDRLPEEVRGRIDALGREHWRRGHAGVPRLADSWCPTRPLLLDADAYAVVGAVADRAAGLVLQACLRRVSTAGELLEALSMPLGQFPLLDPAEALTERLLTSMRADVMVERGVPKVVELNIDGAIGGAIEADLIAAQFQEVYAGPAAAADPSGSPLRTPPSAVDAFFTELVSFLGLTEGGCLVVPVFREDGLDHLADLDDFICFLAPMAERGKAYGITVVGYPLDGLTLDDRQRLRAGEHVADGVFRLFLPVEQAGPGLDALGAALRAGTARMYTPEATSPVSDKRVLAWLWEDLDLLGPDDRDFVRRHVPYTVIAGAEALGEDRASLVLKPGDGYGGAGVVLGRSVEQEEWRERILAAAGSGDHILQQVVEADLVTFEFAHETTGEIRSAAVPCVLGPMMYGRGLSGIYVRHGSPKRGDLINTHQGAASNSVLIVESPTVGR